MRGFDDPRGRQGEQLAFEAERALNTGEVDRARTLFAQAAELEEKVVADTNPGEPRVKRVLAVSAVALWYKAYRLSRAQTLARHYLALGTVIDDDLRELDGMIREARRRDDDSRAHPAPARSRRSEAAQQYSEVLGEIEWRRAMGSSTPAGVGVSAGEIERLWANLSDEDHEAIERDLEALETLETLERTGEFLCVDVGLDKVGEVGPRAAQVSR